jgi:hypothetical protein
LERCDCAREEGGRERWIEVDYPVAGNRAVWPAAPWCRATPGDAARHVLQRFPRDEAGLLSELLDLAAEAIEAVAQHGVAEAMNQFNRDWLPELSPA